MNKKRIFYDGIFILISALFLVLMFHLGWYDKYKGFALIPLMMAYYLGKFTEQKTKLK